MIAGGDPVVPREFCSRGARSKMLDSDFQTVSEEIIACAPPDLFVSRAHSQRTQGAEGLIGIGADVIHAGTHGHRMAQITSAVVSRFPSNLKR